MAFDYLPHPEHQLLLIRVYGSVSLAENLEIGKRLQATLEQSETCMDVFFDLRSIGRFPLSINQLRQSSAMIKTPKLDHIILLMENNAVLSFVATMLLRLQTTTDRIRTFNSLEDALTFLHSIQDNSPARQQWISDLRSELDLRPTRFTA